MSGRDDVENEGCILLAANVPSRSGSGSLQSGRGAAARGLQNGLHDGKWAQ